MGKSGGTDEVKIFLFDVAPKAGIITLPILFAIIYAEPKAKCLDGFPAVQVKLQFQKKDLALEFV
jgi:hypothetical protein